MRLVRGVAGLALLAVLASAAAAEDYPTRPVRIILGFGPGASGDVTARILAPPLGRLLGEQFVIENRTGAASNIASAYVAHAAKDGYTLLLGTNGNTVNAAFSPNLGYRFPDDFAPIALIATQPNLVVAHPSIGVKTIAELIALAKAKPDGLLFGSAGVGSGSHFAGELFNLMAGTRLVHVPYAGSAQAATDLLGGRVQIMFAPASSVLQHVQDGKLIALATTQLTRTSAAPDLPTVSEAGLPGYDMQGWFGLLAPAGTPARIVERLVRATEAVTKMDEFTKPMEVQGFEVAFGGPDELSAFVRQDIAKWSRVVAAMGPKN
jgi:tripartite-type tricarboxylate transporter receptor subunit TctC